MFTSTRLFTLHYWQLTAFSHESAVKNNLEKTDFEVSTVIITLSPNLHKSQSQKVLATATAMDMVGSNRCKIFLKNAQQ